MIFRSDQRAIADGSVDGLKPNDHMTHEDQRVARRQRGFTLIELLVVMTILGLMLATVPPMFSNSLSVASLRGAARDMAAGLRATRSEAITRNREAVLTLDLEGRRYTVGGEKRPRSLPADIDLSLFTAAAEKIDDSEGGILFFPDGSSTGGSITLADDGRRYEIVVDWLTGKVSIVD